MHLPNTKTNVFLLYGIFAGLWSNLMVVYYKSTKIDDTKSINNIDEYIQNFGGNAR